MKENHEGADQYSLISRLCNIRRDIVSTGYDEALEIIHNQFPIQIISYKSGQVRNGWPVPSGWEINRGFVETPDGDVIMHTDKYPLSVGSYSVPVDIKLSRNELLKHVVLNKRHECEPSFLFNYYDKLFKFSCGSSIYEKLLSRDGIYRAVVESRFYQSELKVAEWYLPGNKKEEFILSSHLCHPYQANDGLSGVATGLIIMKWLSGLSQRKYSYRLIVGPETIGSVCWLSDNMSRLKHVIGGIFLEMTGLDQRSALQRSYQGDSTIDNLMIEVFREMDSDGWVSNYRGVIGNDERQYNGPGIRIPMLSYSRALPWGHPDRPFKEYHSALDNLPLVSTDALQSSYDMIKSMISGLESDFSGHANFYGEGFLSGMGLALDRNKYLHAMRNKMKIMDMLDGSNSVHRISNKLKIPHSEVRYFLQQLEENGAISAKDLDFSQCD